MTNKLLKILLTLTVIISLAGCSNSLYIQNSIPRAKVVLEKNPQRDTFYSDTYSSITQRIFDDNIKILDLKVGKNKFKLRGNNQEYAIYFILPDQKDRALDWKYIINTQNNNDFKVTNKSITKIR